MRGLPLVLLSAIFVLAAAYLVKKKGLLYGKEVSRMKETGHAGDAVNTDYSSGGEGGNATAESISATNVLGKEYLNALVDRSVEASNQQASNIAFVKTHKTASTTFAALLSRYAWRHHVKLAWFSGHNSAISLDEAASRTKQSGHVDIMHYHITPFGSYKDDWEKAMHRYAQIMRDPVNINYVTVFREPRSHILSYYYYYLEPQTQQSIGDFLMHPNGGARKLLGRLYNPLSAEFGVKDGPGLKKMITEFLPEFKMVILLEHFDEGLMVLRDILNWDLIDMTYVPLLKTSSGRRRYDGKVLKDVPHFSELLPEVQDKIDTMIDLDIQLYNAATEHYEEKYRGASRKIEDDLRDFQALQALIQDYLAFNSSSNAFRSYRRSNPYTQEGSFGSF